MNDFLGRTLRVGDTVVHASATSGGLSSGIVTKITAKRVTIESPRIYKSRILDPSMYPSYRGSSVPPENVVIVS